MVAMNSRENQHCGRADPDSRLGLVGAGRTRRARRGCAVLAVSVGWLGVALAHAAWNPPLPCSSS